MEIRQLRALLAVADTGSVTAAAKTLHVVQPAVTKQIHALESELGVELFERSRSGMSLNANGKRVLERARRALEELDRARAEVLSGTGEDVRGRVSIGLLPSTVGLLAAELISIVSQRYPGIALRVDVGYAGHLAQWLELGDVDVALLFEQPSTSAFRIRPLLREDLWAVAPSSAGLHADEPVTLEELLQHPPCCLPLRTGCAASSTPRPQAWTSPSQSRPTTPPCNVGSSPMVTGGRCFRPRWRSTLRSR